MLSLTRLSGSVFLLNADLIERVDSTPDTVITLVDGKKYVVADSMDQVLEAVLAYRAEIVALSSLLESARDRHDLRALRHLASDITGIPGTGPSDAALPQPRREGQVRLASVTPVGSVTQPVTASASRAARAGASSGAPTEEGGL